MKKYFPEIEHAFENVKRACEDKLAKIFPAGIPAQAKDRLNKELEILESQNPVWQSEMEVYRLLCEEARKSLQYLFPCVTDVNRYVMYLLNDSLADPLPPHYYCERCGRYEEIKTRLFGIDLPQKKCLQCGETMRRGGFNLLMEFACDVNGNKVPSHQYRCSTDFLPFAERLLKKIFQRNEVVALGALHRDGESEKIEMILGGFFILPEGQSMKDYPSLQGYLEDGTPCLSDDWHDSYLERVELMPYKPADYLANLQRKTGIYSRDICLEDLKPVTWTDLRNTLILDDDESELLYNIKPKTFSEMVNVIALSHNSYVENEKYFAQALYMSMRSDALKNYPCYTREDFYETIRNQGFDEEFAFRLAEAIRKGKLSNGERTPHNQEAYERLMQMPEAFREVASQSKYVVPRGAAVQMILIYAMLAYYLKENVQKYRQVVFRDKKLPSSYIVR